MKAIKLQRGNKLHHYWLLQYIKAIVLHQREFEFEFWPIRKFHFIQPGPVPSTILNYCPIRWLLFTFAILNSCPITGRVAILNYCPIRRLLSICHLAFLTNQRQATPPPKHPRLAQNSHFYTTGTYPCPGQGETGYLCTVSWLKYTPTPPLTSSPVGIWDQRLGYPLPP